MFGLTTLPLTARCPNALAAAFASAVFATVLVLGCVGGSDVPTEEVAEPTGAAVVESAQDLQSIMVLDNSCGIPDPAIDASYASRSILNLPSVTEIHAGLFEVAQTGDSAVEPNLAETFTQSNDGTLYEFRLRQGLRFSDGSDLTASDVKWSW